MIVDKNYVFTLDEIKKRLLPVFSNYGIKRAVLFGSYSKNHASGRSDVDICVDSGLRGLKFVGFIEEIRNALGGKDVDVFDVTHVEKESLVEKEINKTGIEIYGLRNRIVHDYEGINLKLIWQIISEDLPELKEKLERI